MKTKLKSLIILVMVFLILLTTATTFYFWETSRTQQEEIQSLNTQNVNLAARLTQSEKETQKVQLLNEDLQKPLKENEFRLSSLSVGDIVAGLKVKEVSPFRSEEAISSENYAIGFTGKTELSGIYTYNDDEAAFTANTVCFEVDEDSLKKLPTFFQEIPKNFFCFSNGAFAKKSFKKKGSTGKATIVIDNLNLVSYPREVWNSAELVKVVSMTQSS